MIDENKIKEAAKSLRKDFDDDITQGFLVGFGFKDGAKWAINEFLKDLWHPMQEEPKLVGEEIIIETFIEGKRHTIVKKYMVGVKPLPTFEAIRWITNWDSFLDSICDDAKMIRWCYFKDLLTKTEKR